MDRISFQKGLVGAVDSRIGGRQENQDHYVCCESPLGLLVVVCDGMGGGPAGKTASTLAADTIASCVAAALPTDNPAQVMDAAIKAANLALNDAIVANRSLTGMGTTCVCLLMHNGTAYIGHLGDSRCYQFRNKKIKFRTTDHSQVAELVKSGTLTEEQARISPYSNIITRAIGIGPVVEPEIDTVPYKVGDRFALMSDGIWGTVSEPILVAELTEASTPDATVTQMVERTDRRGQTKGGRHDNLTLAVVDVLPGGAPFVLPLKSILAGIVMVCVVALAVFFGCRFMGTHDGPGDSDVEIVAVAPDVAEPSSDMIAESYSREIPSDTDTKVNADDETDYAERPQKDDNKSLKDTFEKIVEKQTETTTHNPTGEQEPEKNQAVGEQNRSIEKSAPSVQTTSKDIENFAALNTAIGDLKKLKDYKPKDKKGKSKSISQSKDSHAWRAVEGERREIFKATQKRVQTVYDNCNLEIRPEINEVLRILKENSVKIVTPDVKHCHTTADAIPVLDDCIYKLEKIKKKFD